MRYYIADLHDMDPNILVYTHRPFANVEEQHRVFVEKWNKRVGADDEAFLLGDVGKPDILLELNGFITVIVGNHDDYGELVEYVRKHYLDGRIYVSKHAAFIEPVILSHEPITFLPPELPYLNIHGHLHGMMYGVPGKWGDGQRYFNVAADNIGFTPISEEEIIEAIGYKDRD